MNEDIQQWIKTKKQEGKPLVCFCIFGLHCIPDEYFREIYHEIKEHFSLCTVTDLEKDQFSMPGDVFKIDFCPPSLSLSLSLSLCWKALIYSFQLIPII